MWPCPSTDLCPRMYLGRVQAVQLLSVEVCSQSSRVAGCQDAPCLVDIEDSLFTEHVDVVDVQLTTVQLTSDVRQLDIDDVVGRLLGRGASAQQTLLRFSSRLTSVIFVLVYFFSFSFSFSFPVIF